MTLCILGLKRKIFMRIQALNYVCGKKGKNGNVIADLVEPGKHAYKQGTIIKRKRYRFKSNRPVRRTAYKQIDNAD